MSTWGWKEGGARGHASWSTSPKLWGKCFWNGVFYTSQFCICYHFPTLLGRVSGKVVKRIGHFCKFGIFGIFFRYSNQWANIKCAISWKYAVIVEQNEAKFGHWGYVFSVYTVVLTISFQGHFEVIRCISNFSDFDNVVSQKRWAVKSSLRSFDAHFSFSNFQQPSLYLLE